MYFLIFWPNLTNQYRELPRKIYKPDFSKNCNMSVCLCVCVRSGLCSLTGTGPLSLVRARAAFHYTFYYKPLHFQHIMMISFVMIRMINWEEPIIIVSILAFHGNCPLSLVRARGAYHYTFDYNPLHFQHIILMMGIVKMMMIDC